MQGENAVIQTQVDRGARDDGRELLHELDRLGEQMRGSSRQTVFTVTRTAWRTECSVPQG